MHTNRLIEEKSPYLLQHAHNPVHWHAWGPEAFEKARTENKPIFLSIGYSTCHWCHVMERESFESEAIAEVLNRHFIPIKVDREERPDVDRIYMTFVQASTGSGGWPMSVWLTPDLKPFFGGTYFPPDSRYGRPGFRQILEQLGAAWKSDGARIVESGDDVVEQLKRFGDSGTLQGLLDEKLLETGFNHFRRAYDARLGGFGSAPKFPRAVAFNFLFRYAYQTKNEEASDMVLHTLHEMAKGGMYDQLGGGFHRYSVDARWFVPHFEKMLYDQAQLAVCYLEGYQISGDKRLAEVAKGILEYVLRDMTSPEGGFYSAEDADSVIDPAHPQEKGEGAFYVWSNDELRSVLSTPIADWLAYRYGAEPDGNVSEDPHEEFTGTNILYQRRSVEDTANHFGVSAMEMDATLEEARRKLLAARNVRVRPHLDDKILTAWNGLMISAFAKGANVLSEPRYLEAANRAADFILTHLHRNGSLLRRYRDGEAAIHGFLDDHAFFIQALLDLHEADFDASRFRTAVELANKMCELFEDKESGGFFDTAGQDPNLVMRLKEDYDGAEPSGNSIAVLNLLRLGHIAGNDQFRRSAERALQAFTGKMAAQPSALPQMLVAAMLFLSPPKQIVLAGDREQLKAFFDVLRHRFLPGHAVLLAGADGPNSLLGEMPLLGDKPTAYVCENFACKLPTTDVNEFAGLLQ